MNSRMAKREKKPISPDSVMSTSFFDENLDPNVSGKAIGGRVFAGKRADGKAFGGKAMRGKAIGGNDCASAGKTGTKKKRRGNRKSKRGRKGRGRGRGRGTGKKRR